MCNRILRLLTLSLLIGGLASGAGSTNIGQFQVRSSRGTQAASSLFEVNTTSKGAIPAPKMTQTQRDAISSPTAGLQVFNTTTNKLNVYTGSAWTEAGSSAGGINYLTPDNDAEAGVGSWATYADAAAATPADGTGGSPAVTWTASSSSPLRGLSSFVLTKDASNRQGQGASYAFTIADADKSQPLNVSFEYSPSSSFVPGTNSAVGDVAVYLYDVTNSTLIQPAPYKLMGGSGANHKFSGVFQASSSSTSYRLILHIAGTTSAAWTLKVDNVVVGPQVQLYGAPVSDPTTYSLTIGGATSAPTKSNSPTTDLAVWWRIGKFMGLRYDFVASTTTGSAAGSGAYLFPLPAGYSIDTSYLSASTGQNDGVVGAAMVGNSGGNYWGAVKVYDSTRLVVEVGNEANGKSQIGSAWLPITGSNMKYSYQALVPIVGWGSNVVMSQDASQRAVALRAVLTTTTTGVADGVIVFNSVTSDTHGAYNNSTGVFTAPVPGFYRVTATTLMANVSSSNDSTLSIRKNGSAVKQTYLALVPSGGTNQAGTASDTVYLNAGDTIDIYADGDASFDLDNNGSRTALSIDRINGPSSVGAAELVTLRYKTATAGSYSNSSTTILDFPTQDYDSHGSVTTGASWKFTAPVSGFYAVKVSALTDANTDTAVVALDLYKNGSQVATIARAQKAGTTSTPYQLFGSTDVSLAAGDYIDIRLVNSSGNTRTLATNANNNWVAISRQGGY